MIEGPDDPYNGDGLATAGTDEETLSYISELIEELKRLAERRGCRTLACILAAALVEARIQREELDRKA